MRYRIAMRIGDSVPLLDAVNVVIKGDSCYIVLDVETDIKIEKEKLALFVEEKDTKKVAIATKMPF